MSRHFQQLALLAVAAAALTQCEEAPSDVDASSDATRLATVAGHPITEADLMAEAELRLSQREALPSPSDLLDQMIDRRALLAKARAEGLDKDPAIRRRMESVLIARLREQELEREVAEAQISEEELREAYEARTGELSRKGQDRFAMLYIEATEKGSSERREEARARLEEGVARSDANPAPGGRGPAAMGFGGIAMDYSDDQIGRYRGGDIGWLEAGAQSARLPAEVLEVGRTLAKGERSEIIETPLGFYVIMKSDTRAGGMPPFEEVSPTLHQQLLVEKRRAIEERFLAEAIADADVSIDADALGEISLPSSHSHSASRALPTRPVGLPTPEASR